MNRRVVALSLLACCSPYVQAGTYLDRSAGAVQDGRWQDAAHDYDKACQLIEPPDERASCIERQKTLFAGHTDAPPASTAASAAAPSSAAPTAPKAAASTFIVGAPQPNAYAVVIGVEHYEGLPVPTGARSDAEQFARMAKQTLGVSDAHTHVALDATKGGIDRHIEWARTNVTSGGRVYFYFSGHGAPDASSGTSYLLPADGDPKFLKQTALLVSEVVSRLADSKAKEVLLVVDSCFSGAGGRSVLPPGARPLVLLRAERPAPRVAVFSASSGAEISGPVKDGSAGLFSSYLFQGIGGGSADSDGDGQVTLQELADWVKPRVARDAKQQDNRAQNPSLVVGAGLGVPSSFIVAWGLPAK